MPEYLLTYLHTHALTGCNPIT
eukprot:COSAG06_NODE_14351_length_1164_cov_1.058216_1_plen_21_part_10